MRKIKRFSYSGSMDPAPAAYERAHAAVARQAAAEGIVLLKNDGLLPIAAGARAALLGSGAVCTVKGGTGSGDVNERARVTVRQGFENAGIPMAGSDWLDDYLRRYNEARESWKRSILASQPDGNADVSAIFDNYSRNVFSFPDGRPLCEADVAGADMAVYVVARIAGEGADRRLQKGDYYLTDRETDDLRFLNDRHIPTALLINAGGPVDLGEADELEYVRAILFISQPGQEGGNAVADVLTGRVSPSGRLTATWAERYEDHPFALKFGALDGDLEKEYYREGVYVGYRYFDTFEIRPRYAFGHGLSYTSFSVEHRNTAAEDGGVTVSFTVTNTGEVPGREAVLLYASCPRGRIHKEFRRLIGFAKTALLCPGQTEELTVRASGKALASFSEEEGGWLLERGLYGLWLGSTPESSELCSALEVADDAVIERTDRVCPRREELEELAPPRERLMEREQAWHELLAERGIAPVTFSPGQESAPARGEDDIYKEAARLADTIPLEDLIPLLYGESRRAEGALGAAAASVPGAAGETTGSLEKDYGVPAVVLADGPAGLRLKKVYEVDRQTGAALGGSVLESMEGGFFIDTQLSDDTDHYYQYCTAFPVGTLLAQTFDPDTVSLVGQAVAEELDRFHVSWWLAPGMNLQRNPLCGRNFEYYSEDPFVSGSAAAAMTRGVQSRPGVGTTIKHFACNNQEDNRMGVDSVVSERALRELYLRGFEIAVKESQPTCVMTSYNLVNGVHSANSRDLCTVLLRDEWGFRGAVMTDWTTTHPHGGSVSWQCIRAGNDLIMPGHEGDPASIRAALASGQLSESEVRSCARRILDVILRSNAFED